MASLLSLSLTYSLLLSLLYLSFAATTTGGSDDLLIREVVAGRGDDLDDILLNAEHHFSLFKTKYGKKYSSQSEHDFRFATFRANLRRAKRHQELDSSAVHGVTKYSDLSPKEFRQYLLGLNGGEKRVKLPDDTNNAPILPTNDLPKNFDWRDHGAVTGVKDQGRCGSCWAFSSIGALEGAHYLATGKLLSLSEQQLVDCDKECDPDGFGECDNGCYGGYMNNAFEYILKAGGVQLEDDYSYRGYDCDKCKFNKSKIAVSVANFSVVSTDEGQIAANLIKNGPLAVGMNSIFMQTYKSGVSCPYICPKKDLNHGVLLVGYGSAVFVPTHLKKMDYWVIKNSWGEDWGENGYYRIYRGHNVCGLDSMVSTVAAVSSIKTTQQD